jgi:hypothetical protein
LGSATTPRATNNKGQKENKKEWNNMRHFTSLFKEQCRSKMFPLRTSLPFCE